MRFLRQLKIKHPIVIGRRPLAGDAAGPAAL